MIRNFKPFDDLDPDPSMKNFRPSGGGGGSPPDVNPMKPPPFPIGGPVGEKPKDGGTKPSKGSGKGEKKK